MNSQRKNLRQKYPDCWKWISLAGRLSGELTEDDANSLFHLARVRTPSIAPLIVELGARQCCATLLLAAGLRDKKRPRVLSLPRAGVHSNRAFYRIVKWCRLEHVVDTTVDNPPDALANWNDRIDILFINATEDYEALHRDFLRWSPFVKLNGLVVLHGLAREMSGISRALAEDLRAPRYGDLRRIDSLAWAAKQSVDTVVTAPAAASAGESDWKDSRREMPAPNYQAAIEHSEDATRIALASLQDYVRRARKELAEDRHAMRALRRSWSWRLTAPLRFGVGTLQAIAGLAGSFGRGSPRARIAGLVQWMLYGPQVRASGLFDERYYRDSHPGVAWAQASPLLHFFVCGASEENKPNELFDVDYYVGRYPDVGRLGVNPLVHYLRNGAYEGRDPHPHFDSSFYLEQNPDVREAHLNPLAHYLAPGIAEGRDPNPWFDTSEYLEQNPDVVDFVLNPLAHQLPHHLTQPVTQSAWSKRQLCSR